MNAADIKVHADVAKFGWHVICVPEDEVGPSFAYSIGLCKTFHHPEIVILGLAIEIMHKTINVVGEQIRSGKQFSVGQQNSDIVSGYDCLFTGVDKKHYGAYFGRAITFYSGPHFEVLQCLWPDKRGLFPSDPNFPESLRKKQALTLI